MENYKMSKEELQRIESIPLPVGIYQYLNGEIITIALTDGFCELFGRENRDMGYYDMIDHLHKYDHPDDIARIDSMGAWFATGGEVYDIVFRTKDRLGPGYRIIHAKGRHIQTETGAHLAYVSYMDEGICADEEGENETALIQSLKHELHEGSLLKANRYDYLTGLPSMSWFFEQAEAWKKVRRRELMLE